MTSAALARNASRLLTEHGLSFVFPLDVKMLAKKMYVKIREAELGEGVTSVVIKERGNAHIFTHSTDTLLRQRFAIASGIGHLYLDHIPDGQHVIVDKGYHVARPGMLARDGIPQSTIDATQFAFHLLLPQSEIKKKMADRKDGILYDQDVAAIAKELLVSELILTARLIMLNIL